MKQNKLNGWFYAEELTRAVAVILQVTKNDPTHWMKLSVRFKYISLRIDQRTGDFLFQDAYGDPMLDSEIYTLFPELYN